MVMHDPLYIGPKMYQFSVEFSDTWVESLIGSKKLPVDVQQKLEACLDIMKDGLVLFERDAKNGKYREEDHHEESA